MIHIKAFCVMTVLILAAGCAHSSAASVETVTLWVNWTNPEYKVLQSVVHSYERLHPEVRVRTVPGQGDDGKLRAAVASGTGPDLTTVNTTDDLGELCASGALEDLSTDEARDHIEPGQFPVALRSSLVFDGRHCAVPFLADTVELYYNKTLLKRAGFSSPPRTVDQLVTMATKLTTYNPNGSIRVLGFLPLLNAYENYLPNLSSWFGAPYLDASGHADLAGNANWAALLDFERTMIRSIGYAKLTAFAARMGAEGGPNNPFETGRLAMVLDGEWRTGYIAREHPNLSYGTADVPSVTGQPALRGASRLAVGLLAIPKGASHPNAAWNLLRYLALDTSTLVQLANGMHNLPTTTAALASPTLRLGAGSGPFVAALGNPMSSISPILASGPVYYDPINAMFEKWETGKITDQHAALTAVDAEIDRLIAQR